MRFPVFPFAYVLIFVFSIASHGSLDEKSSLRHGLQRIVHFFMLTKLPTGFSINAP